MDRIKVHRIVEYIRSCGEFCFECEEVIEDVDAVLSYYGISDFLDQEERLEVIDELLALAEQAEIAEAVRATLGEVEPASLC